MCADEAYLQSYGDVTVLPTCLCHPHPKESIPFFPEEEGERGRSVYVPKSLTGSLHVNEHPKEYRKTELFLNLRLSTSELFLGQLFGPFKWLLPLKCAGMMNS